MTPNVVNPFSAEMARRQQEAGAAQAQALQHHGHAQANPLPLQQGQQGQQQLNTPVSVWQQQTFTSTDALLGELLREVLEMRRDVEALQAAMTDLAGALREKPQPAMPPNALRHSR